MDAGKLETIYRGLTDVKAELGELREYARASKEMLGCVADNTGDIKGFLDKQSGYSETFIANTMEMRNGMEGLRQIAVSIKAMTEQFADAAGPMTAREDHVEEEANHEGKKDEDCNEAGDNENNQCRIVSPQEINHLNYHGKDLLAELVESINLLLEDQELTDVEYVNPTRIHIEIPLERAYEYSDGVQEDIEVYFRALFPKIKQLFESVGWEVSLKEKGKCGDAALEFYYDVPESGYWGMVRKLEEADAALVTVE